jgi:hypothetical protein
MPRLNRSAALVVTVVSAVLTAHATGASAAAPGPRLRPSSATASASVSQAQAPLLAIDGNAATSWNSGGFPPQWIDIDLGCPAVLQTVRLLPNQVPPVGYATHEVQLAWVEYPAPSDYVTVATLAQTFTSGHWVQLDLPRTEVGVRHVRITTTASRSWVGWAEIELYEPTPSTRADTWGWDPGQNYNCVKAFGDGVGTDGKGTYLYQDCPDISHYWITSVFDKSYVPNDTPYISFKNESCGSRLIAHCTIDTLDGNPPIEPAARCSFSEAATAGGAPLSVGLDESIQLSADLAWTHDDSRHGATRSAIGWLVRNPANPAETWSVELDCTSPDWTEAEDTTHPASLVPYYRHIARATERGSYSVTLKPEGWTGEEGRPRAGFVCSELAAGWPVGIADLDIGAVTRRVAEDMATVHWSEVPQYSDNPFPAPAGGWASICLDSDWVLVELVAARRLPSNPLGFGSGQARTDLWASGITLTHAPASIPGFTISVAPPVLSVGQGGTRTSTVTIAVLAGFNDTITLSVSGLPAGATATFNPPSIAAPGSGSSALSLTAGTSTPAGTSTITITGSGGGLVRKALVTFTVQ